MDEAINIAQWSRIIGILFWEKLKSVKHEDGYAMYEYAGRLINTVKNWNPDIVCIPDTDKLGFVNPDEKDEKSFTKARDLFVLEWNSAFEEMETMAVSGEMTWDEVWDELRVCKNSGRPMAEGFLYCGDYYASMADLLMDVSWKDYLDAYNNGKSDDTMCTQWEGYLRY